MGKVKSDKSNISQHANSASAEMGAKERITEQLNLLQARGLVKKDASNANLKKVKKAPMKKAQKVKKMKVMDRARIIAEKEEQRIAKQEQKTEKKKIRKAVWE